MSEAETKEKLVLKKGKPTWKPANVDEIFDKEDGYRYRKVNKDPNNFARKLAEQWEVVSDTAGSATKMESGYGRLDDGKPLTSVRENRDSILMRMPEDIAKERDAYINGKSARQVSGLRKQAEKSLSENGAPTHGSISMEKKGVRTIIKD